MLHKIFFTFFLSLPLFAGNIAEKLYPHELVYVKEKKKVFEVVSFDKKTGRTELIPYQRESESTKLLVYEDREKMQKQVVKSRRANKKTSGFPLLNQSAESVGLVAPGTKFGRTKIRTVIDYFVDKDQTFIAFEEEGFIHAKTLDAELIAYLKEDTNQLEKRTLGVFSIGQRVLFQGSIYTIKSFNFKLASAKLAGISDEVAVWNLKLLPREQRAMDKEICTGSTLHLQKPVIAVAEALKDLVATTQHAPLEPLDHLDH